MQFLDPPTLPQTRSATADSIADLRRRVGDDRVVVDESVRQKASRDYAWMSPVLTLDDPAAVADVVVRPRSTDELFATLAVAYDHDVAVTPRGRGTGNYGQAIPLAGGIVIDLTGLTRPIEIDDGSLVAGAGATFTELEAAANETGQELAMFPSTTNSVLGGFLGGGAGGTGSVEHGLLWESFVDTMDVAPCWQQPELQTVIGADCVPHLHTYGTTGIIAEARIRLAPRRNWTAAFASFDDLGAATAAGQHLLTFDPVPRNISVDDAALVSVLPPNEYVETGRASLRAVVDASTVDAFHEAVEANRGTVSGIDSESTGYVVANSFNHITLRAKRADPSWCHVQVGGALLVEDPDAVRRTLPDAMLHLDGMSHGGHAGFGGLLISRWVDRETLDRGMADLAALGVFVTNPHTWVLGAHVDIADLQRVAERFDPKGLLNPGKLPRSARP